MTVRLDDAGNGRVLGQLLLLDEKLERAETAAAGLNAVVPVSSLIGIEDRADAQGLEQAAERDVGGEVLDAGIVDLGFADVGGVEIELVERDRDGEARESFGVAVLVMGEVLLAWVSGPARKSLSGSSPSPFPHFLSLFGAGPHGRPTVRTGSRPRIAAGARPG